MNKFLPNLLQKTIILLHNKITIYNHNSKIIKNKNAFTIIELLIVIVIITILVGVMVTIIDPIGQQNKAEDAVIFSTLNKIILSANSHTSAYGYAPTGNQLLDSIDKAISLESSCDTDKCVFKIDSVVLPKTCDYTNYLGTGEQDCHFYYEKYTDDNTPLRSSKNYKMYVKNFGTQEILFYDSKIQRVQICENNPQVSNCIDL